MKHPASFQPSELVLAEDHSVYHLRIHPEQLATNVLLVGDPGRVDVISERFDQIDFRVHNRELKTHTGRIGGVPISVVSTGMGTDNIDIVVNELDACVNIDLENRRLRDEKKRLNLVRLGTSGALQAEIPVGTFVAAAYGVGLDGLAYFYQDQSEILCPDLSAAFIDYMHWPSALPKPYAVQASGGLLDTLAKDCHPGITVTAPGFYGPQGRTMRLPLAFPTLNEQMDAFAFQGLKLLNYEMETSALYALGRMLGHEVLTICTIIANRKRGEFLNDYKPNMSLLIDQVLERLSTR